MLSPRAIRERVQTLVRSVLEEPEKPRPITSESGPILDTRDPIEHLRRAIAASRANDRTAPNPAVYSQLRLMLNQLESGRVSEAPTRELSRVEAPVPASRPRLRSLLRRKANAVVRRLF